MITASSAHIATVICHDGLGHARRSLALAAQLYRLGEGRVRLTLVADPVLTRRVTPPALRGAGRGSTVEWLVPLGATRAPRTLEERVAWLRAQGDVASLDAVQKADLVLSDNLPGVLESRPDVVLVGSFLWSDVLCRYRGNPAVDEYIAREHQLLAAARPPMLCVGDVVMRDVLERTRAVRLGWMCNQDIGQRPSTGCTIAVIEPRSGADALALRSVALHLVRQGYDVASNAPRTLGQDPRIRPFSHHWSAWDTVGLVVCRPGMGTLTDCVARAIPLVAVYGDADAELAHNGCRIAELGIGADAGACLEAAIDAVAMLEIGHEHHRRCQAAMLRLDRNGLPDAVDWLVGRLAERHPCAAGGAISGGRNR